MIRKGSVPLTLYHGNQFPGELWGLKVYQIRGINLFDPSKRKFFGTGCTVTELPHEMFRISGNNYYFSVVLKLHFTAITVSYQIISIDTSSPVEGEIVAYYEGGGYKSERTPVHNSSKSVITIEADPGKLFRLIEIRPVRKADNKTHFDCLFGKLQVEYGTEATPYESFHDNKPGIAQQLICYSKN